MARVIIPRKNWHMALADAIDDSNPGDVIVVRDTHEQRLGQGYAKDKNKTVVFEIA